MPDGMRCVLCGREVLASEPCAPTSDGEVVHIACADAEAARVWARRQRRAIVSGGTLVGMVFVLAAVFGPTGWVPALAIIGTALHALVHRRFWYFVLHNLRRFW